MLVFAEPIIQAAVWWALGALILTGALVLVPLALGPSQRMLGLLQITVVATTPIVTAMLAAAAAMAATAAEGAEVGVVVGTAALLGTTIGLTVLGAAAGSMP